MEGPSHGNMGRGGDIPFTVPHHGSTLRRTDICRVRLKKEVKISFSKVRREMEKFMSRESVEG